MMFSAPKVIITCMDLAIQVGPDMFCYAQTPNTSNPNQQWLLAYYPEKNAVAMLIDVNGITCALSAPSGESYPKLRPFLWDDSYLWKVPPIDNHAGISTVRTGSLCLTWEGAKDWKVGTKLQYWDWNGQENQKWKATR